MGSIKKKLTKTLRKITPKEIAPILPYIAMAIPGMGPIAGNALLRYGLPQLLTAAGSARTSGDINLLNQAMALAGSYAAGPGGKTPTKGQIEFAKTNPQTKMVNASRSAKGASSLGQTAQSTLAASDPVAFARANPDAFKTFMADNPAMKNTFMEGFNQNIVQPFGSAINEPFSKEGLMTIGAAGTTMAGGDAMRQATKEQEEADAISMGAIGRYRDATDALKQYFLDQRGTTTYEDIYGEGNVPDFLMAADGGRVNKNMGGMMNAGSIPQTPMVPQGMQLDGRGGGFIPMGAQEKKDDVPAMLAKNEFVMTSDAVKAAGGGSVEKGAQRMYDLMNQLEAQV
jgi:hypothetical protein|tara:strand:+ start:1191 stop:2216 length:1026 start_codon:yes stop_codon:yes gene_type:complete